ncbi:MAG: GNAT family N-acetyltransferase [Bdellovibrionota bacterium]
MIRIHVLGASGSGTSTLGRALSKALALPYLDADDFFWEKTDPPFTTRRGAGPREEALQSATGGTGWVLSGSIVPWGDFLRPRFSHVIFLSLPGEERLRRIRAREQERFGPRILPGADMHAAHLAFLDWARSYDDPGFTGRSLALHERWLRALPCPVLRINGLLGTEQQVAFAREAFAERFPYTVAKVPGSEAAPLVDPFYSALGRSARARPGDLFFTARGSGDLLGTVRFCVEEGVPMLRGMLIAERARQRGVGGALLEAFEEHLKEHQVRGVFCVPFTHLESFYARAGFVRAREEDVPRFLQARLAEYRAEGTDVILMLRP